MYQMKSFLIFFILLIRLLDMVGEMVAEIKNKYCNVTKESIMLYLQLCSHCQKKSTNKKRGLVSKPILHNAFNSRAQVYLIDMQSQHFNDLRFIFCYQDHLTKFVILRPLKSKRAEEIAYNCKVQNKQMHLSISGNIV